MHFFISVWQLWCTLSAQYEIWIGAHIKHWWSIWKGTDLRQHKLICLCKTTSLKWWRYHVLSPRTFFSFKVLNWSESCFVARMSCNYWLIIERCCLEFWLNFFPVFIVTMLIFVRSIILHSIFHIIPIYFPWHPLHPFQINLISHFRTQTCQKLSSFNCIFHSQFFSCFLFLPISQSYESVSVGKKNNLWGLFFTIQSWFTQVRSRSLVQLYIWGRNRARACRIHYLSLTAFWCWHGRT